MERRRVLRTLGTVVAGGAVAGCQTDGDANGDDSPSGTVTAKPTETRTDVPVTGPPAAGGEPFDENVPDLMADWDVPGGSVAISREGRLAFARGYGLADADGDEAVEPASLFRIGSISKSITAVAVLDLVERDALSLDDRAFELLDDLVPEGGPADPRVFDITVRQLLRHTSGLPGRESSRHPMFRSVEIARDQGEDPPASAEATIRYVLGRDLESAPGDSFDYSNVGYCVLGRLVEAVTDDSYESYVRSEVLTPLGCSRMQIGATRREGRLPDEVRYHGHSEVESLFPDEGSVPRPYGTAHLPANDADGGWVGSTVDCCRFLRGVDGRSEVPDVLDAGSVETLTTRPDLDRWAGAEQYYGMGWYVIPGDGPPSLWHNGSLPGSYGFLFHRGRDDLTMAALFNGRPPDAGFAQFNVEVQRTLLQALGAVESWPDRDLFDRYP